MESIGTLGWILIACALFVGATGGVLAMALARMSAHCDSADSIGDVEKA